MVSRIHSRRRKQAIGQVASIAVAVFIGVAVTAYFLPFRQGASKEYYYGGVACHTVKANMIRYLANDLPADETQRFHLHIAQCPKCGPLYERMTGHQQARSECHDPNCPHCHGTPTIVAVDSAAASTTYAAGPATMPTPLHGDQIVARKLALND